MEDTLTLNHISHCKEEVEKLLEFLGKAGPDDEPLSILTVLDICGIEFAIDCLSVPVLYVGELDFFVACVRLVQHRIKDPRILAALDCAERYAQGEATWDQLDDARGEAGDACWSIEEQQDLASPGSARDFLTIELNASKAVLYTVWEPFLYQRAFGYASQAYTQDLLGFPRSYPDPAYDRAYAKARCALSSKHLELFRKLVKDPF